MNYRGPLTSAKCAEWCVGACGQAIPLANPIVARLRSPRRRPIIGTRAHGRASSRSTGSKSHDQRLRPAGGCAGKRRRRAHLRAAGGRKSRRAGIAPQLEDRAGADAARAGGGLHGGDAGQAYRPSRGLPVDVGAGRAEFHHGCGLRPSRRDADAHDHRTEGDHERAAGALPDRGYRGGDAPAHQDDAADRVGRLDPRDRARCVPRRGGRAAGAGASRTARGHRGRTGGCLVIVHPHPIDRRSPQPRRCSGPLR